jgi:hypothetical protein
MNHARFLILRPAFALALLAGAEAAAAPLSGTAAVQTRPEAGAPAFGYLKAGTEPAAAADAAAPDGWLAVAMPGPFQAYVKSGDLTKSLDVAPGASLYLQPAADAPVLTLAEKGDKISITGLRGKWTQIRLDKTLTGYIATGPSPAVPISPAAGAPAGAGLVMDAAPAPAAPPPNSNGPGHAADSSVSPDNTLPRLFEGKLVSSHHFLGSRAPYDWQVDDADGNRIAFIDVSKLLLTEQIAGYVGHNVQVSGVVRVMPEGKGLVIAAENLTLKE